MLGLLILVSGKNSAGDTRLIGCYDDQKSLFIQPPDGFRCSREEAYIIGTAQVAHIFDDGAIPVEKNSATARRPAGRGHEASAC